LQRSPEKSLQGLLKARGISSRLSAFFCLRKAQEFFVAMNFSGKKECCLITVDGSWLWRKREGKNGILMQIGVRLKTRENVAVQSR
jgi:hypothetical protein